MISGINQNEQILDRLVEEICAKIQAGTEVDIEQLILPHPEVADQLRKLYPTLLTLAFLDVGTESTAFESINREAERNQTLGDFRILRQIGRGGMGVVYEAEQLTIHRKVALKILPLAALVDTRSLQRFKNEVTAIATLEHPHITSVYSIGEERGIHYFAMQLIRGQSVAAVIRELRTRLEKKQESVSGASINQIVSEMDEEMSARSAEHLNPSIDVDPDQLDETLADTRAQGQSTTNASKITDQTFFRNVVRLIQQAADALQHAHDHGIVHRDVKPGNLLLDMHGSLFVSDFGLARIETGAGVTMTGDVLGTLRYMSPEQVLANRVMIDHRTDVYSLGATLYEFLTLQPMWSGDNKAELIRQISFEEPKQPQNINPTIPVDLDTIVLKAISKNPNDRYDNAQSLSDDLQHFLDHKPIVAKRSTTIQRVAKWTRRNPAIMWSGLAILFVLTMSLALGVVGFAISNDAIRREREVAKRNEQRAREVVDQFLTRVSEETLLNTPAMQPMRKELLEFALIYYEKYAEEQNQRPAAMAELALALDRVGKISLHLGLTSRALQSFSKELEILEKLVDRNPQNLKTRLDLANCHSELARVYGLSGIPEKAMTHAISMTVIAEMLVKESINDLEYLELLAKSYNNHGMILAQRGKPLQGAEFVEKAIVICKSLTSIERESYEYRRLLGSYYNHLGSLCLSANNFEEAIRAIQSAIEIFEREKKKSIGDFSIQHLLAKAYNILGSTQIGLREFESAKASIDKAIGLEGQLVNDNPDVVEYRQSLAKQFVNLARTNLPIEGVQSSIVHLKHAYEIRKQLAEKDPTPLRRAEVVTMLSFLVEGFDMAGDVDAALRFSKAGVAAAKFNLSIQPQEYQYQFDLAQANLQRAHILAKSEAPGDAEEFFDSATSLLTKMIESIDTPKLNKIYVLSHTGFARFLKGQGRLKNAEELLAVAYATIENIHGSNHELTQEVAAAWALTLHALGMYEKAEPLFLAVADYYRQQWSQHPNDLNIGEEYWNALNTPMITAWAPAEKLERKKRIAILRDKIDLGESLVELSHGDSRVTIQVNLAGVKSNLAGALQNLSLEENDYAVTEYLHEAIGLYEESLLLLDNVLTENPDHSQARQFQRITLPKKLLLVALTGQHDTAANGIEDLISQGQKQWIGYANAFVCCAIKVNEDPQIESQERAAKVDHYETRAVFCLQQAFETKRPKLLRLIVANATDEHYESLRNRPQVQEMLLQIEKLMAQNEDTKKTSNIKTNKEVGDLPTPTKHNH